MKLLIASDHGGVALKQTLINHLSERGHQVTNLGVDSEDPVDYPDIAVKAARAFADGNHQAGILICGTGIGISIAANKLKGIRCALIHDIFTARMAREHNNANFVALGGRVSYQSAPEAIVDAFLDARYDGGERHQRRIDKIGDCGCC